MIEAPFFPLIVVGDGDASDPFLGCNRGLVATEAHDVAFPGFLLAFADEHGYRPAGIGTAPAGDRSIWFHRPGAGDLGTRAEELARFVAQVCATVCGTDPVAREAFRVVVLAHGRGILPARICAQDTALIDKLVLLGADPDADAPETARRALGLAEDQDPTLLYDRFDPERVLCLTPAAAPRPAVRDAATAKVPTGEDGLTRSAAVYRCCERFLFGDVRVDLRLFIDHCDPPKGNDRITTSFAIDHALSLRGTRAPLQASTHAAGGGCCASLAELAAGLSLGTVVLSTAGRVQRRRQGLGFGLDLRLFPHHHRDGAPWVDDHFPGQATWGDGIQIDVTPDDGSFKVLHRFATGSGRRACPVEVDAIAGCSRATIAFERKAAPKCTGRIQLMLQHWNNPEGDYLVLVSS